MEKNLKIMCLLRALYEIFETGILSDGIKEAEGRIWEVYTTGNVNLGSFLCLDVI